MDKYAEYTHQFGCYKYRLFDQYGVKLGGEEYGRLKSVNNISKGKYSANCLYTSAIL